MIVFAHTKFGLVQIRGSGVKRGADSALPPWPEGVFEIPAWIGLKINHSPWRTANLLCTRYI